MLVPDPLIVAYAHDPLAVGVYVAIARLAMVAKAAVPLAARDLVAWMGSDRDADRAAIMRRIVKLEAGGWVMIERTTATKHRLVPTWGRDQVGVARPWRFDTPDGGRPSSLRGRRVPLALFDDYLGRLDPRAGPGCALVSRYLTQPLLDLADIGVYTVGLRAEIAPTPRLRHLGLHSAAGMLPPVEGRALLAQAAVGALTTLAGDAIVPVCLSMQGHACLGTVAASAPPCVGVADERLSGSECRSPDGSRDGSPTVVAEHANSPQQNGQESGMSSTPALIAWDVGIMHESTKHDSTPDHAPACGGSTISDTAVDVAPSSHPMPASPSPNRMLPSDSDGQVAPGATLLGASVVEGHCALNPMRPILPGEWHKECP